MHRYLSEVAQSCPTLCDPVDCSPPGSSVHGILQARVLEWVAISFSRGSSRPRDRTQVSRTAGRRFNLWATREAHRYLSNFLYADLDFLSEINILKTFFFLHGLLPFQNQNILQLLKAHRNIPCVSWQEIVIILSSNCSDCGKVRMLDYMCQRLKISAAQWTACWSLDRRRGVYRCKLQPIVNNSTTSAFLHLH